MSLAGAEDAVVHATMVNYVIRLEDICESSDSLSLVTELALKWQRAMWWEIIISNDFTFANWDLLLKTSLLCLELPPLVNVISLNFRYDAGVIAACRVMILRNAIAAGI